jgi:hypothetical protein
MYVSNITSIPSSIMVFQGENYNIKTLLGISLNSKNEVGDYIAVSSNLNEDANKIGRIDYSLNLFGGIPIKDITVNVIPKTYVVPVGSVVGLKLYTSRSFSCWNERDRRK